MRKYLLFTLIISLIISNFSVALAASTTRSLNWAGYSLYYNIENHNEYIEYAQGVYSVAQLYLPDEYEHNEPIALGVWVGLSYNDNGSPILVQSGWGGFYNWNTYEFNYIAWIEAFPQPPQIVGSVHPGDTVISEIYAQHISSNKVKFKICIYVPAENIVKCNNMELNTDMPRYAHYIVETPYTVNGLARPAAFYQSIEIYAILFRLVNGNQIQGSTAVLNGMYIRCYMKQGSYINIDDTYDIQYNRMIAWYLTSKR